MLLIETDGICLSCRIDLHEECTVALAGDLPDGERCCCAGLYDRAAHLGQVARARKAAGAGDVVSGDEEGSPAAVAAPPAPIKGDSGYIHPDAWPSSADIGTLADVSSTGRKRVAKMYPITAGQVCEWAKLRYAGNGPKPIIGCMGNPASELHHGPDKNTLNNEKASRGVGTRENVHVICSDCHNAWHAANDEFYPDYSRDAQQTEPWIPYHPGEWGPQDSTEQASFDELVEVARVRDERRRKRGRDTAGRNSRPRAGVDLGVDPDEG